MVSLTQSIEPKLALAVERLNARPTGNGRYRFICPICQARGFSGAIDTLENKVLINLFCSCDKETELAQVGLTFVDLFPDRCPDPTATRLPPSRYSKSELFDYLVVESGILSLAINDLLECRALSKTDHDRAIRAYQSIMTVHCQVYGGSK
jgi:hypothetical protein